MDIVKRLRDTMHTGGALIGPEAADEIERLRKTSDAWRELAEFMYPFVVDVDMRSVVAESIEGMMIAVREATT